MQLTLDWDVLERSAQATGGNFRATAKQREGRSPVGKDILDCYDYYYCLLKANRRPTQQRGDSTGNRQICQNEGSFLMYRTRRNHRARGATELEHWLAHTTTGKKTPTTFPPHPPLFCDAETDSEETGQLTSYCLLISSG